MAQSQKANNKKTFDFKIAGVPYKIKNFAWGKYGQ